MANTKATRGRRVAAPSAAVPAAKRLLPLLLCLVIAVAGLVAYANSFAGKFILDDALAIKANHNIRGFWPPARFFHDTRPVVDFTLAINYALGEFNEFGYHVFNVAVHLLAAMTLFGIVRRTLLLPRWEHRYAGRAEWIAFAAALLWVAHPLCTQAVTYIIQRAESLMALFYLLTLYTLIRGATSSRSLPWYVAAIAACALGMGCKAVMASVPVVALLFDVIFLSGSCRETLRRRWPLYAGLFASEWVLFVVGVIPGLFVTQQRDPITVGFGMQGITWWEYARTQPAIILHYLRLCLWPDPLCVDYGWPVARRLVEILPAALVVLTLAGAVIYLLARRRPAGFLGACVILILLPTSSIVPIRDLAFEHRMYLPLAAVLVLIVLAGHAILRRGSGKSASSNRAKELVGLALVGLVASLLLWGTIRRNAMYADPIRLWQSNIALTPAHARPHNALGWAYFMADRHADAIASYRRAIELDPLLAGAYANIGDVYWKERRFAEAVANYEQALRISPFEFTADFHYRVGSALMEVGRLDEAVKALEDSLYIDPESEVAHYNLGNALRLQGRLDRAIAEYREALRISPRSTRTYVNLGLALSAAGRGLEAIEVLQKGLETSKSTTDADAAFKIRLQLGKALLREGRKSEARDNLRAAVEMQPHHAAAAAALREAEAP